VTKSTDEELLLASGRGDRGAFALLVERHQRAVIQFVHRFLATADRATAEDLAQQVFLNAWRYAPTFEPRAKVLTWLFRIASNACLNYRRREQSRISAVALDESTGRESDRAEAEGVELRLVEEERAREVRAAVAALPSSQRVAIVLRYFHEFSHADIAAIMETSLSAVDSLLHRGRWSLHARLGAGKKEDFPQDPRTRRAQSR
jgi:RNA polymerase sigma-70 factor (ECF subfamily)